MRWSRPLWLSHLQELLVKSPVSPPVWCLLPKDQYLALLSTCCSDCHLNQQCFDSYVPHLLVTVKLLHCPPHPGWKTILTEPWRQPYKRKTQSHTLYPTSVVFNKHQFAVCSLVKFLSIIIVVLDYFFQVFSCVLGKWLFNLLTPSCQKSEVFQAFSIIFSFMVCPD